MEITWNNPVRESPVSPATKQCRAIAPCYSRTIVVQLKERWFPPGNLQQWEELNSCGFQSKSHPTSFIPSPIFSLWRFAIDLNVQDHGLEKAAPAAVGRSSGPGQQGWAVRKSALLLVETLF